MSKSGASQVDFWRRICYTCPEYVLGSVCVFDGRKIILASQSARRRELLKYIFEDYEIIPSGADETPPEDVPAENVPEILAVRKAVYVAKDRPHDLVIGCDTVVILDGKIFGKPADLGEAREMLFELSGRTHRVVSGVCICCEGRTMSFSQTTEVTFYPLSAADIERYITEDSPLDKAGSYGIQDRGGLFVKELSGDHYNVIGFPIARLKIELERFEKLIGG